MVQTMYQASCLVGLCFLGFHETNQWVLLSESSAAGNKQPKSSGSHQTPHFLWANILSVEVLHVLMALYPVLALRRANTWKATAMCGPHVYPAAE